MVQKLYKCLFYLSNIKKIVVLGIDRFKRTPRPVFERTAVCMRHHFLSMARTWQNISVHVYNVCKCQGHDFHEDLDGMLKQTDAY